MVRIRTRSWKTCTHTLGAAAKTKWDENKTKHTDSEREAGDEACIRDLGVRSFIWFQQGRRNDGKLSIEKMQAKGPII